MDVHIIVFRVLEDVPEAIAVEWEGRFTDADAVFEINRLAEVEEIDPDVALSVNWPLVNVSGDKRIEVR